MVKKNMSKCVLTWLIIILISASCGPVDTPCEISSSDHTEPQVDLTIIDGENRWDVGTDDKPLIAIGTPGHQYPVLASAEDDGCVSHLEIHIVGGEFTRSSAASVDRSTTNTTGQLLAASSTNSTKPGVLTLWAEAKDYNANSAETGSLHIAIPGTWQLRLNQLTVKNAQEDAAWSDGDEPYLLVYGFRSTLGKEETTEVTWNGYLEDGWAGGVDAGDRANIPERMGLVEFPNVTPLTEPQVNDIEWHCEYAHLDENNCIDRIELTIEMPEIEIVGAVIVLMESDSTPWGEVKDIANDIDSLVAEEVARIVETELPRKIEEEIEIYIETNCSGMANIEQQLPTIIQQALRKILDSVATEPELGIGDMIRIALVSALDPDDVIGSQVLIRAAIDPDMQDMFSLPILSHSPNNL